MSVAEMPVSTDVEPEASDDELQTRVFEELADTAGADISEVTLGASLEKALGLDSLDLHDFAFRLAKITGTRVELSELGALWGGHPPVHGAVMNHKRNPNEKMVRRNATKELDEADVPQPTVADLMNLVHEKMGLVQR